MPNRDDGPRPDERQPHRRRRWFGFLEVDALIDSGLYGLGMKALDIVDAIVMFSRRFRLTGWRWLLVDLLDDIATFGTAGSVLMLALALPAFQETHKDWRQESDYAVTFLDRYGNEIGKRGIRLNDSVPLDQLPPYLIKAVLATEDRRFFEHFGIDIIGTSRALVENLRHQGVTQGGSSLTQQLAKNLFLSNERSFERKIKEAFLALWLEANLSKREILKLYLDRAYMGGGTFGVAAAAEFYFGKNVRDISLAEAAMLAGLFKAPTKYAPHVNLPAARARANDVLSNLVTAGYFSEGQVLGARRNPAKPVDRSRTYSPDYFLDYAFQEVQQIAPVDHSITVKTSIDIGIQKKSEEVLENALRQYGEEYDISQGAIIIGDPDGSVRAMVGGRDYGSSQYNRATDALRQPGSSFKPYVYTAALTIGGYNPQSIVNDHPFCIGDWCPHNFGNKYLGSVTLTTAIAQSLNSIPVQLVSAMGREKVAAFVRRFGINLPEKPDWPFVIGAIEVHVIDQFGGYATFANGGYHIKPHAVDQIINGQGHVVYDRLRDNPPPERIVPEDKIAQIVGMMHHGVEAGTGTRAKLDGIPAAGKTGTTQESRDAWFCGYTGNLIGIVWTGNDDNHPMNKVTGGFVPAQMWHDVMTFAHTNIELKQGIGLPPPDRRPSDQPVADKGKSPTQQTAQAPSATPANSSSFVEVRGPDAEHPWQLNNKSLSVLTEIEGLMRTAPLVGPKGGASITPLPAPGRRLMMLAGDGLGVKGRGLVEVH
ncbi:MAG: PBP1A family penicillin-binding protein [Ancalomicrobiaceae bacterium]|nr:PBP1A family penicillin-binding protein [Ancalomicrobiaceae bacterium]